MIASLTIKNTASYSPDGVEITNLKKVNFFFGNNGSGKSTLARYLYSLDTADGSFNQCSQSGYDPSKHQILVFNQEFIDRNFIKNKTQKGIFSLNETNDVIDGQIENEEAKQKKLNSYIAILDGRKQKIEKSVAKEVEKLTDKAFDKRKDTIKPFIKAEKDFPHARNKEDNLGKLSDILKTASIPSIAFETLLSDYKKYYDSELKKIENSISVEYFEELLKIEIKLNDLLQKIIVGNNDIDIATLINSLGINKWVEDGIKLLDTSKDVQVCPFCQKETVDKDLIDKFGKFFNEAYKKDITDIEELKNSYIELMNNFIENVKNVAKEYNINNATSDLYDELIKISIDNSKEIDNKLAASNEKKELCSIGYIKDRIELINSEITTNNNDFQSLSVKQNEFKENVWRYIANECKEDIENFNKRSRQFEKIIEKIESLKIPTNEKINSITKLVKGLKTQTVSTDEAVKNINGILEYSGFQGFEIKEKSKTENNISEYCIVRNGEDGEAVFQTLSEGEKNFITFLYFYQLCLGVDNLDDSGKKKIIVIDDPVSSLDSQVLFIVNTLVRKLIEPKGKNDLKSELKNETIEQIFILTHNIYFFKEVKLDRRPMCSNNACFHILKNNKITKITKEKCDFIKDDYSHLWNTLRTINSESDKSKNILIANTMRRILESYVNFLNIGADAWGSIKEFDNTNPQYIICYALISEINDSSHKTLPLDSMYFTKIVNEEPQNIFNAFKMIFDEIGSEHYAAMMKEES